MFRPTTKCASKCDELYFGAVLLIRCFRDTAIAYPTGKTLSLQQNYNTKGSFVTKNRAFTLPLPSHIVQPPYASTGTVPPAPPYPEMKTDIEINHMRKACSLAREVLNIARDFAKVGVTTEEINEVVHNATIERGAYPSPLNYRGFPKSVCTSVNEVVCHGIPDSTRLEDGDIINVDVSIYVNGFHGDLSETFLLGNVDDDAKRLVSITKQCLEEAIAVCKHDECFSLIGKTISNLATRERFKVSPRFIGHGIGRYFHGPPDILHFENNLSGRMKSGMTFTIEPILTEGSTDFIILDDGWTCVSCDGCRFGGERFNLVNFVYFVSKMSQKNDIHIFRSAQFEHTVLITDTGADVLTANRTRKNN